MSALDQLRERANKREAKLRKQREKRKGEKRKLQRIKEEAFRTTGAICIEPFASRSPLVF
jgi:hypothetical protein